MSQGQATSARERLFRTNNASAAANRMPHYTGGLSRRWLIVPLLILYLFDLGGVGFLSTDEPRYASIGREMARSHDFVTPRLDGSAWFEKPPLLYWMTAAGHLFSLPDEWAARLPVALMSIAFLVFFYLSMTREFSRRTAIAATAILSTSAGWLAYSFVAVTDLPMSATLAAAMLIAMFDTRRDQGYVAGALLGLSVLAKAFVPLVLFAPMFLIARGKRLTMIAGCIVVAAPWYFLCSLRNGAAFWQEIFWKQQVGRFFAPDLQHVQPIWFYLPILLAGLFPWTPLAGLLMRRKTYADVRVSSLVIWLGYALVFFSLAKNKLPGYVLPLLPPLAIVLAVAIEKAASQAKWWLGACGLMLAALPLIIKALPEGLLLGFRKAPLTFASLPFAPAFPFIVVAAAVWWLAWRDRTAAALLTIAIAVVAGITYVKLNTFPILDERVSVRGFWRANRAQAVNACLDDVRRDWEYGLNYYADRPLPECVPGFQPRISVQDGHLVFIDRGE
jgi:4-amino-4-deoxy-L-arabinose transferase-like glycosyltransferase